MNILFVAPRVPEPPNKGDKIRSHHLMKRIAASHAVHVACLADDPEDLEHARAVGRWAASVDCRPRRSLESAWRGAFGTLLGRPLSDGWFRSGALRRDVRGRSAEPVFDVAVAYCSSMAGYLDGFDGARVIDFVDVDSEKWRKYADRSGALKKLVYSMEAKLVRSLEQKLTIEYERGVIISARERDLLGTFADTRRVEVVTNGVDVDYWGSLTRVPSASPEIVFVGAMDYFANEDGVVDFVQRVFPHVRKRVPDVTFRIVGRRPGPAVTALGAEPGVEVVGEVDDVRPQLARATLAVVPLRIAQGLQNKVLEAMAAGVPVVTSASAVAGISGSAGEHFTQVESTQEWGDAIEGLVRDAARAADLAGRASALVRDTYSWDTKAREYASVLEAAVRERRSGGTT